MSQSLESDDSYSIFVSHASVDEEIAQELKKFLGRFWPQAKIFVSSDPEDLAPGDPWVEKVIAAPRSSQLVIALTTERGLSRKWVWFESGRTWFSGVPMIPCCTGSSRKSSLPAPFSSLQALNIDDARDLQLLVDLIQKTCGGVSKTQDLGEFVREISRLDVRAEERSKLLADPFAAERIKNIETEMKGFSQAEQETFRQFVIHGELTTAAAKSVVGKTGVSMDRWSVPSHLCKQVGWILSKPGNSAYDEMQQNSYSINPTFKRLLEDYFSRKRS